MSVLSDLLIEYRVYNLFARRLLVHNLTVHVYVSEHY